MPVDLTELLESVPAPPMHVDADAVLTRGRRRRLRRRLGGAAAVLGAAALIVPVADALRVDGSPPAVPAVPAAPAPQDCLFPGQGARSWWSNTAGSGRMTGTPWLDSGAPDGDRTVRVQVNTDTCHGLAVAVSNGTEGGVTTADLAGPSATRLLGLRGLRWRHQQVRQRDAREAHGGGPAPPRTAGLRHRQRLPSPDEGAAPSPQRGEDDRSRPPVAGHHRDHRRHRQPTEQRRPEDLRR